MKPIVKSYFSFTISSILTSHHTASVSYLKISADMGNDTDDAVLKWNLDLAWLIDSGKRISCVSVQYLFKKSFILYSFRICEYCYIISSTNFRQRTMEVGDKDVASAPLILTLMFIFNVYTLQGRNLA